MPEFRPSHPQSGVERQEISHSHTRADFELPTNAQPDELEFLEDMVVQSGSVREPELERIRDQYLGGPRAISLKYHPCPASRTPTEWERERRLIEHVNLVKPAVRAWNGSLYSGYQVRKVVKNPHEEVIKEWLESPEYLQTIQAWDVNKILYGTAVAVPVRRKDGSIHVWLPDPLYTHIYFDPIDLTPTAVAEAKKDRITYVTLKGQGYMTPTQTVHTPANFGILPVVIGYGEDMRHYGSIYGDTLVRDPVYWSTAVTDTAFNLRLLQKQETANLLVVIGNATPHLHRADDEGGGGQAADPSSSGHALQLDPGSDAKFIGPNPKIAETVQMQKHQIGLVAMSTSLPADVLDSTLSQAQASAESARIRAIPLVQRALQRLPLVVADEKSLVLMATAVLEWHKTKNPINLRDLKKRVETNIQITPNIIPETENELIQNALAKWGVGAILPEDLARILNPGKTPAEYDRLTEQIKEQALLKSNVQVTQKAVQDAAAISTYNMR